LAITCLGLKHAQSLEFDKNAGQDAYNLATQFLGCLTMQTHDMVAAHSQDAGAESVVHIRCYPLIVFLALHITIIGTYGSPLCTFVSEACRFFVGPFLLDIL
jgi:hypothetical protein